MELMGISSATLFFGAALVRALDVPGGWISRATSWNVLRFFGKYSYGLYVLHQPIILVMAHSGLAANDLVPRLHGRLLAVLAVNVVALACSVLAAILSWNFLEKQFLKLKSRPALNY
jgi:peptidoglycan/LPS O-acetylase OafA/YrhL